MKFSAEVVPTGHGEYGPFADGNSIPYLDFAATDGSGADRATVGQGADAGAIRSLPLFKPVVLDFETTPAGEGQKRKLRTFGPSAASVRAAA
jgi:hypothetical protein